MQESAPYPALTVRANAGRIASSSRLGAGALALVMLMVLATAAWLTPASVGHGTHRQLGMPECSWVVWFGRPCITCGMTTSFAHAANMDFVASFRAQPAGCLLAVLCSAVFWVSGFVAVTGSRAGSVLIGWVNTRTVIAGVAILLAAWVYKLITWT